MELRALRKATLMAQGLTGWMLKLALWGLGPLWGLKQNALNFLLPPPPRLYKLLFFAPRSLVSSGVGSRGWCAAASAPHLDFPFLQ